MRTQKLTNYWVQTDNDNTIKNSTTGTSSDMYQVLDDVPGSAYLRHKRHRANDNDLMTITDNVTDDSMWLDDI